MDFGPKRSVQDGRPEDGGGGPRRRAVPAWGLAQFGREIFAPGGRWRLDNRGMRVLSRPRSLQPV